MIKLILTDIDMTILPRGQKVVSQKTLAAIDAVLDAGLVFGPASGRALPAILPTFAGEKRYVETALATNGMQVYLKGGLIHEEYLPREELVRVNELVRLVPKAGLICFKDGKDVHLVSGEINNLAQSFPAYAKNPIIVGEVPEFPIVKANVFIAGDMQATQDLFTLLKLEISGIGFNVPMSGFLNITPIGYSKADGIDYLCQALGISLDEVMVFGDAGNDIEMLEHVPNSVAVANATDEVKAVARYHIGFCDDEAVADVLLALAKGESPFDK